jgi:hypothetical protein
LGIQIKEGIMKKVLAAAVTAAAFITGSGIVFAAEDYPTQEASVTMTVSTPDGKVLQEETVTDTTKGADTTSQYKALQKTKSTEKKDAATSEMK